MSFPSLWRPYQAVEYQVQKREQKLWELTRLGTRTQLYSNLSLLAEPSQCNTSSTVYTAFLRLSYDPNYRLASIPLYLLSTEEARLSLSISDLCIFAQQYTPLSCSLQRFPSRPKVCKYLLIPIQYYLDLRRKLSKAFTSTHYINMYSMVFAQFHRPTVRSPAMQFAIRDQPTAPTNDANGWYAPHYPNDLLISSSHLSFLFNFQERKLTWDLRIVVGDDSILALHLISTSFHEGAIAEAEVSEVVRQILILLPSKRLLGRTQYWGISFAVFSGCEGGSITWFDRRWYYLPFPLPQLARSTLVHGDGTVSFFAFECVGWILIEGEIPKWMGVWYIHEFLLKMPLRALLAWSPSM